MSTLEEHTQKRTLDAQLTIKGRSKKWYSGEDDLKAHRETTRDPRSKRLRTRGPSTTASASTSNIEYLQTHFQSNLIDDAQNVGDRREIPEFTAANKKEFLREAHKTLPGAELSAVKSAFDSFASKRALKARNNCLLLSGMKTPLKLHQVLGVAFMRDREHSETEPRGGILADEMGFGSKPFSPQVY